MVHSRSPLKRSPEWGIACRIKRGGAKGTVKGRAGLRSRALELVTRVPMEHLHPLAAALRRDQAVKALDLGVQQLEGPLPVDTVSAEGRSLAHSHRFEEIRCIGATTLLIVSRVDRLLAHFRPAKASRGEIGELTAAGISALAGIAGSIRSAKATMMMRNMSVVLIASHRPPEVCAEDSRTISPLMRSPEWGIAWCVEGHSKRGRLRRAAGDCKRGN